MISSRSRRVLALGALFATLASPKPGHAQGNAASITVVDAHTFQIRFYLKDRYLYKEADGVTTAEAKDTEYRLPLPDAVFFAGVEHISLLTSARLQEVVLNEERARVEDCATLRSLKVPPACSAGELQGIDIHAREVAIRIPQPYDSLRQLTTAVVLVRTHGPIQKPVGWTSDDLSNTTASLGTAHALFDFILRDTSIRPGSDGMFYLTGSTGAPDMWAVTGDIQVWKSPDLQTWTPVITKPRARSVVWNVDREGTWQKLIKLRDGAPFRPLWAPEIHFLKGTYWLPYSIPRLGTGLLKSTSGKPEGPYISALKVDAPLTSGIDASLFEDADGQVYFLWAGGMIARMTSDMSGLAEPGRQLRPANAQMVGFEGSSLFRFQGRYYLSAADFSGGDYNCFTASSTSIYGPYSDRYISVPHGGHNNFFQDSSGHWWSTYFGNDAHAGVHERPAIVAMHFDEHGELKPAP